MFKKILIANRGEIAVRVARTCREMGIATVALYEPPDESSLHVRAADECVRLDAPRGFMAQEAILNIALAKGADAIHPGYGFVAEDADFARACEAVGIAFIGPPPEVIARARAKTDMLAYAREAGFKTVRNSGGCGEQARAEKLRAEAERLGYPVIVKSCRGGRGRGERIVPAPAQLEEAVRRAQAEAQTIYGSREVFLEKLIPGAHQVGVQIMADAHGRIVHLGEREGSLLYGNQKVIEEAPAPCLDEEARRKLWSTAVELARAVQVRGVVTVEFLVDAAGVFYFTEIKPRIQTEHPLTEMRTRLDLVREQIRLAAGEPLTVEPDAVRSEGWAILCRINAQDPGQNFMPSPGRLRSVRMPDGPETRTDTYVCDGANVPGQYDPLIAKVTTWGTDRRASLARMKRALRELSLQGVASNMLWVEAVLGRLEVIEGRYSTESLKGGVDCEVGIDRTALRDLALAAAVSYRRSVESPRAAPPERVTGNWHRESRRLPE
jgi:acetyl/propionyl-CoA carboxylase alpha subunit